MLATKNIVLIIVIIIVIMLIISIISPIIQYKGWYNWYNTYDPDKKYRCISITDIAYFNNNVFLYKIKNMFGSEATKFKYDFWVYFITSFMFGAAINITPGGFVTPKNLCESLIPDGYPTSELPGKDSNGNSFGYVWPSDLEDWKTLLKAWGKIDFNPGDKTYTSSDNGKSWMADPNNFLWEQWGIPYNSPLVMGFLTGWSSDAGNDLLWPDAMNPLLGKKSGLSAGGWIGYLQLGDDFAGRGLDEANRIVWDEDIPVKFTNNGPGNPGCNGAAIASGSISMGMGGAFAGSMIGAKIGVGAAAAGAGAAEGAAEGSAAGPWGALAGAVIGLLVGGLLSAGSQKGCL